MNLIQSRKILGLVFCLSVSNLAFGFDYKTLSKGACLTPDFALAIPDNQRSLGLRECNDIVNHHTSLKDALVTLEKIQPLTEEKLIATFGQDWPQTLTELKELVFGLKYSQQKIKKSNTRIPIVNKYVQIDGQYINALSSHYEDLIDRAFSSVMSNRMEMKDARSARKTFVTLDWAFRQEEDQGKMPRSRYLYHALTCSEKKGADFLVTEHCKLADKQKDKYMATIKTDQATSQKSRSTKDSSLPSAAVK